MTAEIKIPHLNYASVIQALLPKLLKQKKVKRNPALYAALKLLDGLPPAAINGTLNAMPKKMRKKIISASIKHFSRKISKMLTKWVQKKGIMLTVDGIRLVKSDTIEIKFKSIDYASILAALLPKLLKNPDIQKNKILYAALTALKGLPADGIQKLLNKMPQKTQDELLSSCSKQFGGEIAKILTKAANKQGIKMTVKSVKIK